MKLIAIYAFVLLAVTASCTKKEAAPPAEAPAPVAEAQPAGEVPMPSDTATTTTTL